MIPIDESLEFKVWFDPSSKRAYFGDRAIQAQGFQRGKNMRDTLRLRFVADSDGTGELSAEVKAKGFSGVGSAGFLVRELVAFAQALAGAYPLPTSRPIVLEGGFWDRSGTVVEQLHLGLKFYPIGAVGLVGCRVSLASSFHAHERPESQSQLALELTTHYEQLHSFARAIEGLATGVLDEACLEAQAGAAP